MNRLLIVISTVVFMAALLNGGTALFMDGDGDFMQLFEPIVDQAPFTVEGWAMMAGTGGGLYAENCLFEQRNRETTFGAATATLLAKNAHQDEASFELRDSESDRIKLAGSIQSFQEWHHYAGVVDNEKITFYIDGIVVNFVNYHFTGAFNTGIDNLSIGRHAYLDIVAGYFNGYIDELRIWDTARSEQQIRDGMFATVDLNDEEEASHLLAYWRFDDFYEFWKNSVQYVGVKDLSGNEHHGAFVDDATLIDEEPIAVTISAFTVTVTAHGNKLEWKVDRELNHAGYNIYRSENEETDYTKINHTLILAWDGFSAFNGTYEYLDNVSGRYFYKLEAVEMDGSTQMFGPYCVDSATESEIASDIPEVFELYQNYPNPFNPTTMIQFYAPFAAQGSLAIHDFLGRRVAMLVNGGISPGLNTFYWAGTDENGDVVSAGLYLCRLDVSLENGGRRTIIRKMTLLK